MFFFRYFFFSGYIIRKFTSTKFVMAYITQCQMVLYTKRELQLDNYDELLFKYRKQKNCLQIHLGYRCCCFSNEFSCVSERFIQSFFKLSLFYPKLFTFFLYTLEHLCETRKIVEQTVSTASIPLNRKKSETTIIFVLFENFRASYKYHHLNADL